MKQLKWILSSLLLFLNLQIGFAQGWENTYSLGSSFADSAYAIQQTMDGGYIITGSSRHVSNYEVLNLLKIDVNGVAQWSNFFGPTTPISFSKAYAVRQTTDGGYILAGRASGDMYIVKTDSLGNLLWSRSYNGVGYDAAYDIQQTTDGGYIIVGTNHNPSYGSDVFYIKTDGLGNPIWTKTYAGLAGIVASSVVETTDGGYLLAGFEYNSTAFILKTNSLGVASWIKRFSNALDGTLHNTRPRVNAQQTTDGGYVVFVGIASNNGDYYVAKTDVNGDTLWTKTYGTANYESAGYIQQTADGGFIICGTTETNPLTSNNQSSAYVVKTDAIGDTIWTRYYGNTGTESGSYIQQTTDGGYIMCGALGVWSYTDMYVVKMDSSGQANSNQIIGNIFQDNNTDCLNNTGDINLSNVILKAIAPNGFVSYGSTDNNGSYSIPANQGTYTLSVESPLYYYSFNCQTTPTTVNFAGTNQQQTVDFPLIPVVQCPLLQVDIAAPFLRTNTSNNYTVSYCNYGTVDAINAFVTVEIDTDLNVLGASIPIVSQNGNVYTFNIGNVAVNNCGNFQIQVAVDSTSVLGQIHCSEAHIYPDSICIPSYWNGAILDVNALCQNDSIFFTLQNIGAAMSSAVQYYVYEDNVMFRTGTTNILGAGGSQQIVEAANTGKTYRIIVEQENNFPALLGDSFVTAYIEGCVPYLNGSFNTGFGTQFSNGSSSPFVAIDCQPNIGSYDPNDKTAQPEGYDATHHYIYDYTALDYHIRFQNTGTDTAFLVVVRDTISPYLDITTIEMGASSHPYTWRVYGQGILEVTFANIMLPDSNVNEPMSNGFFRYRIQQKANNPVGTIINNLAAIYFDFNAPVLTNQTWHTLGDNFVVINLITSAAEIYEESIDVLVYPNPFNNLATVEVQGKDYQELNLTIYDLTGREVAQERSYSNNKIQLSKDNLQTGIYVYKLEGDGKLINSGKIVVQ